MKKTRITVICLFTLLLLTSCAAPYDSLPPAPASPDNSSVTDTTAPVSDTTEHVSESEETEIQTFPIEEQITNFRVLTDEEKNEQRRLRMWPPVPPLPIVEWEKVARSCPFTTDEILSMISVGDDLKDVYEKIGYPTYRDILTLDENGITSLSREFNYLFMYYKTADGGIVWIEPGLAGCIEEDYQYIVTEFSYTRGGHIREASYEMDYVTKVSLEAIPVFMAVEEKGVDYLLKNGLITPYEATLYAAEEAIYQASLSEKETSEQVNE